VCSSDLHDPGRELRGTPAIRQGLQALRAAFPDIVYTVEAQLAEGDLVASRYRGTGTHLSDWRGVPASGRRFSYTGILIQRFEGGKIAEFWGQADLLGLLRQLSMVQLPGPPLLLHTVLRRGRQVLRRRRAAR
jgi:predicted ester cyclase